MRGKVGRRLRLAAIAIAVALAVWFLLPKLYGSSVEVRVQETVVRHLVARSNSSVIHVVVQPESPESPSEIKRQPASPELMRRLSDIRMPQLVTGQTAELGDAGQFTNSFTHKPVSQCILEKVRWRNAITAEVRATLASSLSSGGEAVYIVRLGFSGWHVVDSEDGVNF